MPWRDAAIAHDLEANDTRRDSYAASGSMMEEVDVAARQDSSMLAVELQYDVLLERPPFDPARKAGETMRVLDLAEVLHVMV
ncbi:MAG: hypothetical protein R3D03_08205 [Geminicoccaceae bacterium]